MLAPISFADAALIGLASVAVVSTAGSSLLGYVTAGSVTASDRIALSAVALYLLFSRVYTIKGAEGRGQPPVGAGS